MRQAVAYKIRLQQYTELPINRDINTAIAMDR